VIGIYVESSGIVDVCSDSEGGWQSRQCVGNNVLLSGTVSYFLAELGKIGGSAYQAQIDLFDTVGAGSSLTYHRRIRGMVRKDNGNSGGRLNHMSNTLHYLYHACQFQLDRIVSRFR
jgi:hypothetical protein